jgi:hypothetical protein
LTLPVTPTATKIKLSPLTGAPAGFQFTPSDQLPPEGPCHVLVVCAAAGAVAAPVSRSPTAAALASLVQKVPMMIGTIGQVIYSL